METRISLTLKDGIPVKLTQKKTKPLNGMSTKSIYKIISTEKKESKKTDEFYVKKSKIRTARQFFSADPTFRKLVEERFEVVNDKKVPFEETYDTPLSFDEITEKPRNEVAIDRMLNTSQKRKRYNEIQEKIQKYVAHTHEVVIQNAFIELIAPRIAKALIDNIIVPDNYLQIDFPQVLTLSRSIGQFNEFLSKHPMLKEAKTPDYWENHHPPKFIDVVKTKDEANILGRYYAIILFLGLKDGINNINGSNFGYIKNEDGSYFLTIVDWGNALPVGFNGLTSEESSAKNEQLNVYKGKVDNDIFSFTYPNLIGFKNCVPFFEIVYPILPRMLISDIYDLTSDDNKELRQAEREGFFTVCEQIISNIPKIQKVVPEVIEDTINRFMSPSDREKIIGIRPTYHLDNKIENPENGYKLADMLVARAESLKKMCKDLKSNKTLKDIAADRLQAIYQSQLLPSERHTLTKETIEKPKLPTFRARL